MAGIWKKQHNYEGYTTTCLKRKVFNECMLLAMIYGTETWVLTTKMEKKLSAAQQNMERNMLNIIYKDQKTNK